MPFTYIISDVGTKSVAIKTVGNEKMQVIVILTELVDSMKLPPYDIEKKYYA
jgi:hypothetical protein